MEVCPSCGGTSLTRTADGGSLVCEDCDERFQGYRQEEMDDEDTANVAAFGRESQQSLIERRRLRMAAEETIAGAKAAAAATGPDYAPELFRGVVVITRAISRRLVDDGVVGDGFAASLWGVVGHWIRMWHAGGNLDCRIADGDLERFRPQGLLAMIALAATFCRSALLPRDIVKMAVEGRLPYKTAGADLLTAEVMADRKLRMAFTPTTEPSCGEICALGSAFAFSEYAWPPLREIFDGPRNWYSMPRPSLSPGNTFHSVEWRAYPVGDESDAVRRLAELLGLPQDFVQRVARFKELRQIATSMSAKAVSSLSSNVAKINGRVGVRERFLEAINFPEDGTESSGSDSDGVGRTSRSKRRSAGVRVDLSYKDRVARRSEMFLFDAPPGLSQLPFCMASVPTPTYNQNEFPTDQSVLIDFISTLRVCYGSGDFDRSAAGIGSEESDVELELREQEWSSCVKVMQRWVTSGGPDATCVTWGGLSPVSLHNLSGEPLKRFAAEATAMAGGSVPLHLLDSMESFDSIASSDRPEDMQAHNGGVEDSDIDAGEDEEIPPGLTRYGNWVWNDTGGECLAKSTRTSLLRRKGFIDDAPLVTRANLLPSRGFMSRPLHSRNVSRGLHWRSLGPRGNVLWKEPVELGLALSICRCFFKGSPGLAAGDLLRNDHSMPISSGCDEVLRMVFNYVDVYLGVEGTLNLKTESGAELDDSFVRMKPWQYRPGKGRK